MKKLISLLSILFSCLAVAGQEPETIRPIRDDIGLTHGAVRREIDDPQGVPILDEYAAWKGLSGTRMAISPLLSPPRSAAVNREKMRNRNGQLFACSICKK